MEGSKRYKLNSLDFKKIAKGGGLNVLGSLIAYIVYITTTPEVQEASGSAYIIITAVATWLSDIGRRFIADNKTKYNVQNQKN